MRVLLVEDDLQIGQSLLRALQDADYSVDWVRDGDAGSAAIAATEYTVVLRAVLRRKAGYTVSRLCDDSLNLDLDKRRLFYNGMTSVLSAREFALMQAFLERPGTILSRDQLEDRLYGGGKEVESNAVDVLIRSVRKKFGQAVIRNVRGLGWTVMLGDSAKA